MKTTVIHHMHIKDCFLWLLRTACNYSGCHQLPERSFFYKGKQFPVCARCTGVSIGQFLAVIINLCFLLSSKKKHGRYALGSHAPVICSGMLSVMGIDWLLQEKNICPSTNRRRLFTGILGGFGLFSLYFMIPQKLLSNSFKDNSMCNSGN